MPAGSWSLAEELFAREDAGFVDELRRVHFADRLGDFAARWIADRRPFARKALLDYLSWPLNSYRHEPLVKRLFKLAETSGDDELMGAFLVAFDRTVRRVRKTHTRYKYGQFTSQSAADAAVREWAAEGYDNASISNWSGRYYANAWKREPVVVMPGNTVMPRPPERDWKKNQPVHDAERQRLERRHLLFSLPTRRYLRRRAWRYFRLIGKNDPARYVRAAVGFLTRYTDADVDSDIHILDSWGLVHALFHHSPALVCPAKGWAFAEGKSLADLAPAPYLEPAWATYPETVFAVLLGANGRAVRQWAVWMLRRHHEGWLASQSVVTLLKLADHADPDLSALGFDLLEKAPDLALVPVDEWLTRLDGGDLDKLQRLSGLLVRRLDPARVAAGDTIRLAGHRSKPVAELGLALLKQKTFAESDAADLLPLTQADSEAVRPALIRWLRDTLSGFGTVRPEWVLEFLDSKHADMRAAGWEWLNASPLRDDPAVWHRLIESPYDDVRGPLVAALSERTAAADPDAVRLLWATVLLNVARGGRHKPGVVNQVVARLAAHPDEANQLIPLLAVALRSLRTTEFRAGLTGVVWLAENKPELLPAIRERFPELEL
ncbi:MAG TPA: hypothetical protein VM597_36980 [Gemmataceae bacterium]|nr:hypothetical protein [Gemmataceae bacterium]